MRLQKDHIYLDNDMAEIFIVQTILAKYGFEATFSKPDENNITSVDIKGKNDRQDLETLTATICQMLTLVKNTRDIVTNHYLNHYSTTKSDLDY